MHLSTFLKQNDLSQARFASMIKVTQASVERYANGKRIPLPDVMGRIAEVTKGLVTANDFYGIENPKKKRSKRQ